MQLPTYKLKQPVEQYTSVYQPNGYNSIINQGFASSQTNFALLLHFLHYSVLKRTISQFGAFYRIYVDKMQNLIFQPLDVIQLLLMNIKTYLEGKYA